jgi:hypothetical protein
MKVDGRCLCGYLTYEARVDPDAVLICHCRDCQTISGSAFRVTVPVVKGEFKFLSGEPKTYVKTAQSGTRRVLAFCPDCGTSVYSGPEAGADGYFGLRVGSLRQRDELIPRTQCWRGSAQTWIDHIADLPAFDGGSPSTT